jgi:hypothetical protein
MVASNAALISGTILLLRAYPLALAGWDWFSVAFFSLEKLSQKKEFLGACKMILSSCKGGIAQRSEQAAHNCLVHGSNPCAPTLSRFENGGGLLLFLATIRHELIRWSR